MLPRCGSVATGSRGPFAPYHGPPSRSTTSTTEDPARMTDTLIPDREQAASEVADLRLRTDLFIGGDFRPAREGRRFTTENPATGQPITEVAEGGVADVDAAVAAARAAFDRGIWSRIDPGARKRVLQAWADLIEGNA